jgi:hypothetical protein
MFVGEMWAPYMWVGKRRMCLRLRLQSAFVASFRLPILYARRTTAVSIREISKFVVAAVGLNFVWMSKLL